MAGFVPLIGFTLPLLWVFHTLWIPIALGAVFAIALYPWVERLEKRKISPLASSVFLSFGTFLLVVIPLGFLIYVGAQRGFQLLGDLRPDGPIPAGKIIESWIQGMIARWSVHSGFSSIQAWIPIGVDEVVSKVAEVIGTVGLFVISSIQSLVARLPDAILQIAILMLCLFVFLLQGKRVVWFLARRIPFSDPFTARLFRTAQHLCRAVVIAMVLSGLAQSIFFGLVAFFAGVPQIFILGLMIFLASFVPLLGASPITFGISAYFLISQSYGQGIVLLIAAILTSALDNFVRPMILHGEAKLHPLIAFLAAIGGIQAMGVAGIFLGPIIVGICLDALNSLKSVEGS